MHFAADIREACRPRRSGKGRWTHEFIRELMTREHALTLFTDSPLPAPLRDLAQRHADRIVVVLIPKKGLRWHFAVARALKRKTTIDAYVSTVSYIVPFLLGRCVRTIPVVHDLIAFRGEPHDKKATIVESVTFNRAMKKAFMICTVSETTREELLRKIANVDASDVVPIFAAATRESPIANDKKEEIVLCIATLCPRKNQRRLIEAHASLPEEMRRAHPLVLVGGRGWQDEGVVRLAEETPHTEWKSYLSDEECDVLFARSIAFAWPSLHEGFGLPILEAMKARVPVLTSNVGSMKEIAEGAALLVNPHETSDIADGLRTMLSDDSLRRDLIDKGAKRASEYSWARTVDLFLSAVSAKIDKRA